MDKAGLEKHSKRMVDLYTHVETHLLVNMAKRFKGKDKLLKEDPIKWRVQMLEALGLLDEDNLKIIQKAAEKTNVEMNEILLDAGLDGLKDAEKDMKRWKKEGADLVVPEPIHDSPQMLSIISAFEKQAKDTFNLTNQTLIEQSKQQYIESLDVAVMEVTSGQYTGEQAIRRTIMKWSHHGIPALIRKDGAKMGAEGYVRTVMRSTTNNVVNKMQDERFDEWGVELVEVSSHAGARPLCEPYQGRIYSIKPGHNKYPSLSETSMGEAAGLFGINCGHYKYPYVEGVSEKTYQPYTKEENDRIYKESQRQRDLERQIRKAKTRKRMMHAAGDLKGIKSANVLIRKRQARMRQFIKGSGRTRRYNREQLAAITNTGGKTTK